MGHFMESSTFILKYKDENYSFRICNQVMEARSLSL